MIKRIVTKSKDDQINEMRAIILKLCNRFEHASDPEDILADNLIAHARKIATSERG